MCPRNTRSIAAAFAAFAAAGSITDPARTLARFRRRTRRTRDDVHPKNFGKRVIFFRRVQMCGGGGFFSNIFRHFYTLTFVLYRAGKFDLSGGFKISHTTPRKWIKKSTRTSTYTISQLLSTDAVLPDFSPRTGQTLDLDFPQSVGGKREQRDRSIS